MCWTQLLYMYANNDVLNWMRSPMGRGTGRKRDRSAICAKVSRFCADLSLFEKGIGVPNNVRDRRGAFLHSSKGTKKLATLLHVRAHSTGRQMSSQRRSAQCTALLLQELWEAVSSVPKG